MMSMVARTFAVLLVFIHLLNVVGCYFVFQRLETMHTQQITDALDDDNYAGSEAITFRIPVSLAYNDFDTQNYQRVDGKVKHNGEVYRLVKQKLYKDTLFVVCVKDDKATAFDASIDDITSSMTDKAPVKKSSSKTSAHAVKDFDSLPLFHLRATRNPIDTTPGAFACSLFSSLHLEIIVPPPQV